MCVDNLTRENNRVLFRKIKFHGFSNYIMSKKSIGNSRRQFYSFLALISILMGAVSGLNVQPSKLDSFIIPSAKVMAVPDGASCFWV